MTKLLLRLFVKNYKDAKSPAVRGAIGKLSGAVGILCNVLLCVGKLLVGPLSGSVSITADAMNNLSDSASSLVTLVGFKLAEKPADEDHPYGHARFEYISGLAVAALILIIGVELLKTSFGKVLHPEATQFSPVVLAVLVGSVLLKLWMCLFNRYLGKHIDSGTLLATAADSRNDCITTTAVLLAALGEKFTGLPLDGWMGLLVAGFIIFSGINIARDTISPLLGENASPEMRKLIAETVSSDPRVLGYHDLMVHDYGPGQRFASIHVEMDRNEDPLVCHEIIDNLERRCLQKQGVNLVIHYDPVLTDDPEINRLREMVTKALRELDSRLTFHDFRVVQSPGHTNLIFDVTIPKDMTGREKEISKFVEEHLQTNDQKIYHTVITFDSEAFNIQ